MSVILITDASSGFGRLTAVRQDDPRWRGDDRVTIQVKCTGGPGRRALFDRLYAP